MKNKYSVIICLFFNLIINGQTPWTQKTNLSGVSRSASVGFSIGTKGYIGTGYNATGTNLKDFWEWDQTTNVWTQKADFGGPKRAWAVGFSIGSKGYIGTGSDGVILYNDFWEWDQVTNVWTQKTNFAGAARWGAVGFSIGTKGYIGTGTDPAIGFRQDFWEWNSSSNTWSQKANFGGTGRQSAVGFSIGSKGYIGTGRDPAGFNYTKDFWEYDTTLNVWTQKANFGGVARYRASGFSIGNKGYIGNGSGYNKDFWEYNQLTNSWIQKTNYLGLGGEASVGFSIGGLGYMGVGWQTNVSNDLWEYNPSFDCRNLINCSFLTSATNVMQGTVVSFTNTSSVSLSNTWLLNGTAFSSSTNAQYTFTSSGSHTISLISSSGICSDTAKVVITVNCATSLLSDFQINQNFIIQNDTVNFTNSSSNSSNYSWYINGVLFSNALNPNFVFNSVGIYTINLVASNNTGCSSTKTLTLTVQPCNVWYSRSNYSKITYYSVGFSIGNKGYFGTGGGLGAIAFWEYDPDNNTWSQKANFAGQQRLSSVGFSIGTKGYIGTGINGGVNLKDFWEWNQLTNTWTQKTNFGGAARYGAIGFSIGNKGYIGTGDTSTAFGYKNDFWEYDPSLDTWTKKANFGGVARKYAVGFTIGNKGYVGTGRSASGHNNDLWEYNPLLNNWTQKTGLPSAARSNASAFSIGNCGYVGGGADFNPSPWFVDFWQYNQVMDQWFQIPNFPVSRYAASAFSINGKGYVGTGYDNSNTGTNGFWVYKPCLINIPTNTNSLKTNEQDLFTYYPNPNQGVFSIYTEKSLKVDISIFDIIGKKIYEENNILLNNKFIDLTAQPDGIYFVTIKTDEGISSKKIILVK